MSLFTKVYDPVMGPLEKYYIQKIRKGLLKNAKGKVLEVGVGTGANFEFYPKELEVVGIEPSLEMLKQAQKKLAQENTNKEIELIHGQAENLPFDKNSFDTVLVTLVLCSVKDLERSLKEMHRVLKEGGTIILFEHIKLEDPKWVGFLQDTFTPPWAYVCDGCHLNRDTIKEAEKYFTFEKVNHYFKDIFVTAVGKKRD